jgi:hypothetical protein
MVGTLSALNTVDMQEYAIRRFLNTLQCDVFGRLPWDVRYHHANQ